MSYSISLGDVPSHYWDEIAKLHVDAVWLMGVWQRSPRGIAISNSHPGNLADFHRALPDFTPADNAGSPYCVKDYTVDPYLGGDKGLAIAREQLSLRGMKLILDFVPNHLAHDHPWVKQYPGFFIHGTREDLAADPVTYVKTGEDIFACGKDPFYPAWQDVLQLNPFHPPLRKAITETLARIAGQCDGVRCDMAMLLINDIFKRTWGYKAGETPATEYWEELITSVRKISGDFLFIAEAYWDTEWKLLQQGFDYCYDKRLYDRLEHRNVHEIRLHLRADPVYQEGMIRFIENHDEPRHVIAFPPPQNLAAAVIFSTLPGAKLFHEGQFEGRHVKLPVFLQRRPPEPADCPLLTFYTRLLHLVSRPVFKNGRWQLCKCHGWPDNSSFENLLAWQWTLDESRFLVVINYAPVSSSGMVLVSWTDLSAHRWILHDHLNDQTFVRDGNELQNNGLFVALAPWNFHLLELLPEKHPARG
jgi:glycosidase